MICKSVLHSRAQALPANQCCRVALRHDLQVSAAEQCSGAVCMTTSQSTSAQSIVLPANVCCSLVQCRVDLQLACWQHSGIGQDGFLHGFLHGGLHDEEEGQGR